MLDGFELLLMVYTPVPPLTATVAVCPEPSVKLFWLNTNPCVALPDDTLTVSVAQLAVLETKHKVSVVAPATFPVMVIWLPLRETLATDGLEFVDKKNGPETLAVITDDCPTDKESVLGVNEKDPVEAVVYGHCNELDGLLSTVTDTMPPGVMPYWEVLIVKENAPFESVMPTARI